MKKSKKIISKTGRFQLALAGVISLVAVFIWLGFTYNFSSDIRTTFPIEQGDTRIQQRIYYRADNIARKYYIHTYIEVYNNGWEKAEEWRDYAATEEIIDIKAMRRIQAEEESVKIGKAIREFYYGKEDSNEEE